MENLETILEQTVKLVSLILEFTAVLCIATGFVKTLILLFQRSQSSYSPLYNRLRFKFGGWLALALEFQLASDIVKTTTAPTYEHLIQLGAIAIIRTFLNYFLNKELKELPEIIEKTQSVQKSSTSLHNQVQENPRAE
ncbi:MAG TPA: DUF1622 domain-containing protein [Chitinophagaceae bacterium]|nr:DUF1622 domain-containing protein [Chitinophagaceae bacterium]